MKKNATIKFHSDVKQTDDKSVKNIVLSTGFFSQDEINIAVELVNERLTKGLDSGYYFIFADRDNNTVGYTCFGPIPATQSSFDLYWIAVHPDHQGSGIGKKLLVRTEKEIKNLGGSRVYIETSGRDQYKSTRGFYQRCGYTEESILADFYAQGDAKYIYLKIL